MSPAARSALLEQASDLCTTLSAQVRADADALVADCRKVFAGEPLAEPERLELKRQLGSRVELLARRDARAMPLAALGRAALAELNADTRQVPTLLAEFALKLSLLGL
ncbi:MAG: hypothetical protein RJA70_1168 [Pseudomonadota bacterium]|jgi:hypothetical protein